MGHDHASRHLNHCATAVPEITGVKGVNASDECNMSKLTKKYDPYSGNIPKANKPNKSYPSTGTLWNGKNRPKQVSIHMKQLLQ